MVIQFFFHPRKLFHKRSFQAKNNNLKTKIKTSYQLLEIQSKTIFLKLKHALLTEFSKHRRKRAPICCQIIRKFLPVKRDAERITALHHCLL